MDRANLEYRSDGSDKVYQAEIVPVSDGFQVNFAYGRRGSTMNTGTKTSTPVPYAQAKKIFDTLVHAKIAASSAEFVGRFWLWESSQVVIQGNFHGIEGTEAVGSSGNHSDFVVEALNGAIGDFSFGSKPIQDQRLMGA